MRGNAVVWSGLKSWGTMIRLMSVCNFLENLKSGVAEDLMKSIPLSLGHFFLLNISHEENVEYSLLGNISNKLIKSYFRDVQQKYKNF